IDVELVRFEQDPNNAKILGNVFRLVHTIKGTCGFLALPRLEALTHAAEALMGQFRDGMPVTRAAVTLILATIDRIKALLEAIERNQAEQPGDDQDLIGDLNAMAAAGRAQPRAGRQPSGRSSAAGAEALPADAGLRKPGPPAPPSAAEPNIASQSIRVHVNTLENLMTMVSELVLTRNQLLDIVRRHEDSEFKAPLQRLSNVTAQLQDGVMKTRMQPIGNAWQKLPRIVRDLGAELGKEINFEMLGADTELDRQVLDLIKDPLTHMVRNAADHGLEGQVERRKSGKPERGVLRLSARHEGGHIIIEVADDGRGLDIARIRQKAIALGLAPEGEIEKMSDALVRQFIFTPGFSTVEEVTNVSGRGVGMDVVRANIDQIGGTIDVKSVFGYGTSFTIRIPLTLAIVSALIVDLGGDRYAIPQLAVIELVRVRANSEHRIERIKDAAVLRLRNKLLPLVSLRTLLQIDDDSRSDAESGFIVVTQVGGQMFGIMVDGVFHTEEIVVKPMSTKLRQIPVFCGNTILGDGSVIMILDPNGVAQKIGSLELPRDAQEDIPAATHAKDEPATESLLVFRAGSPAPKAVLLSLVTRLEEIDARSIEMSSGRALVQYRGQLMPLVLASEDVRIRSAGAQPLLVFVDGGRSMGLVVDEIVDIVEERLTIELASQRPGLVGQAVIKGQATEVIDIAHFLPLAFEDWTQWRERRERLVSRRVLLVDDAPFFRHMLCPVLQAAGFAVTAVGSAAEALAQIEQGRHFDVVVTDLDMPVMSGFDLAAALRADPRMLDVPIIGLSSLVSPGVIERGRQVGLHDYVAKFDRHGLIAALKAQTAEMERAA
ncbi:MAG: two-component system, chemotaxis family, sensor kinase CheA, partial [Alphaproteobacteria bacterium]|nr:two-component system, chemotaxis family, sensor kinase CheA [Alphaproteobacteria bacterium]